LKNSIGGGERHFCEFEFGRWCLCGSRGGFLVVESGETFLQFDARVLDAENLVDESLVGQRGAHGGQHVEEAIEEDDCPHLHLLLGLEYLDGVSASEVGRTRCDLLDQVGLGEGCSVDGVVFLFFDLSVVEAEDVVSSVAGAARRDELWCGGGGGCGGCSGAAGSFFSGT